MELLRTEPLGQSGHRGGLVPMHPAGQALLWEFKGHILCGVRIASLQEEVQEGRSSQVDGC